MASIARPDWSADERLALHTLYRRSGKAEVMGALPGRTWAAITRKANLERIRRTLGRTPYKLRGELSPIIASLRDRRIARQLGMKALARMIPCHRDALHRWENGEASPRVAQFEAWVKALGGEIRIADKPQSTQGQWAGVRPPSREQLMARRAA